LGTGACEIHLHLQCLRCRRHSGGIRDRDGRGAVPRRPGRGSGVRDVARGAQCRRRWRHSGSIRNRDGLSAVPRRPSGGNGVRGGRRRHRRSSRGRRGLLFLRIALHLRRRDVLPRLGGFRGRRIKVWRALRDLLLQIGDLRPRHVLSRVLLRHYRGGFTGRGSIRPVFLRQRGQHVDIVLQLGGFGTRRIEVVQALRQQLLQIGDLAALFVRLLLLARGYGSCPARITRELPLLRLAKLLERLEVFPDLCGFSAPRIEFM
jgi:hypothetical protein